MTKQSDDDEAVRPAAVMAGRLQTYLIVHGASSILLSALLFTAWLAVWDSFGGVVALLLAIPNLYPLLSGLLILYARRSLVRRELGAPRLIRWAMAFAVPVSLFIGGFASFLVIASVVAGELVYAGWYLPFALIGLSSVLVLARVLKVDLDELVWAGAATELDASLNYREDDDVELDFAVSEQQQAESVEEEAVDVKG